HLETAAVERCILEGEPERYPRAVDGPVWIVLMPRHGPRTAGWLDDHVIVEEPRAARAEVGHRQAREWTAHELVVFTALTPQITRLCETRHRGIVRHAELDREPADELAVSGQQRSALVPSERRLDDRPSPL